MLNLSDLNAWPGTKPLFLLVIYLNFVLGSYVISYKSFRILSYPWNTVSNNMNKVSMSLTWAVVDKITRIPFGEAISIVPCQS